MPRPYADTLQQREGPGRPFADTLMQPIAVTPGYETMRGGQHVRSLGQWGTGIRRYGEQVLGDVLSAATLPGDVWAGRTDPASDEALDRAAGLAGMVTLGAGAMPAVGTELGMGIRAYHGSPHSFDRFDSSKIGTGEGAQVYGHGMYMAENEAVARQYRDNLSGGIKYQGVDSAFVETTDNRSIGISNVLKRLNETGETPEGAIAAVRQQLQERITQLNAAIDDPMRSASVKEQNRQVLENMRAALDGMDKIHAADFEMPKGSMYEVDIAAEPEQFLDWDKPLSQQSEGVRQILNENWMAHLVDHAMQTGEEIYRSNTPGFVSSGPYKEPGHAEASAALREAGIPGIRYLDQGSRAAGEGSRNYVVFDDKLLSILRKYGIPGGFAAGLMADQSAQPQGT